MHLIFQNTSDDFFIEYIIVFLNFKTYSYFKRAKVECNRERLLEIIEFSYPFPAAFRARIRLLRLARERIYGLVSNI
jgi:hypothetical protein